MPPAHLTHTAITHTANESVAGRRSQARRREKLLDQYVVLGLRAMLNLGLLYVSAFPVVEIAVAA